MQNEGKWKEKSIAKKPVKDKVYKRTLEVMKMMMEEQSSILLGYHTERGSEIGT